MTVKTRILQLITSIRFQRLGREFFWICLGQGAAVLGGLVGVRILTELLEPEAYGQLALGMTVATLVNQVVTGPLSSGVTRFYAPAQEAGTLHAYLTAVRGMVLTSTGGIILVALLTGGGLVLAGQSQWMGLGVAALCFALPSGYNSILNGIQSAARQRTIVALHQGLASWGRFLVAAWLMLWLGATSTVAMLGYGLTMLIVLASQYVFFGRILKSVGNEEAAGTRTNNHQWRTRVFTYSWPFATWGIFSWAQQVSDRWALGLFSSTQEVGLYAVLFQLGYYPISLLTDLVVTLVKPVFFQRAGDATDGQRMEKVNLLNRWLTWFSLGLTILGFLVAFVFSDFVFHIFVAPEYSEVAHLLPWMLLSGGIFASGQIISINYMNQLKSKALIAPKIATAALGICLNILGAKLYGINGIVVASVAFSVVFFVWMLFGSRKHVNALRLLEESREGKNKTDFT